MTLRCAMCNRPLKAFSASVRTRAGVIGWGPKCAAVAGQVLRAPRTTVRRDRATVDWVAEAAR